MEKVIFKGKNSGVSIEIDRINRLSQKELIRFLDCIKKKIKNGLEDKPVEFNILDDIDKEE